MLKKMIIHGLIATALIGTVAAVYAEGRDSGYLSHNAASINATETGAQPMESNGYLTDSGQRKERHKSFFEEWDHDDEKGMEHNRKHGNRHDDD